MRVLERVRHICSRRLRGQRLVGAEPQDYRCIHGVSHAVFTEEPGPTRAESSPAIAPDLFDAGNLRVLAQWGTERLPNFADAPTFREAGYPDVVYILWTGVFAPKKTPERVTRILRDTIRPFMQDKAVVERLLAAGSQVSYMDGPEFERFLEGDTDRLVKIVRKIGLS